MVFNSSEGGREVKVSGVFVSLGGKGGLDHFTLVFFYTHSLSLSLFMRWWPSAAPRLLITAVKTQILLKSLKSPRWVRSWGSGLAPVSVSPLGYLLEDFKEEKGFLLLQLRQIYCWASLPPTSLCNKLRFSVSPLLFLWKLKEATPRWTSPFKTLDCSHELIS